MVVDVPAWLAGGNGRGGIRGTPARNFVVVLSQVSFEKTKCGLMLSGQCSNLRIRRINPAFSPSFSSPLYLQQSLSCPPETRSQAMSSVNHISVLLSTSCDTISCEHSDCYPHFILRAGGEHMVSVLFLSSDLGIFHCLHVACGFLIPLRRFGVHRKTS